MTQNNKSFLEIAKQLVNDLYDFRDNYFINCDINKDLNAFKCKRIDVNNKLQEVLKRLDELSVELESTDKSLYCLLRGRALNITDKYDEKAFELLSQVIKLKPQLTEAWNQLGECYRKRGDNYSALNCFESVLKYEINKISLRNASIVLRQLGNTAEEKNQNLLKSVDKAKKAVECDVCDGISWYILGNAYLTLFFKSQPQRDNSVLNACKAAYLNAYNNPMARTQTDFLLNYAIVLQYDDDYHKALQCLQRAVLLDPEWEEPLERKGCLMAYLKDCTDMIAKKAFTKTRIQSFINKLVKDSKLPIYINKTFAKIEDLTVGLNSSSDLLCKVIGYINNESAMAQTYCVVDCDKQCVALLIYNMSAQSGPKLGDTIAVEKPFLKEHDFCFEDKTYRFRSIRIENPLNLFINNKKVSKENIVLPKIDNTLRND